MGKPTKARYRHTFDALKRTQTRKQQASKGEPRGRKMPLERAQMDANAFMLVRAVVARGPLHSVPLSFAGSARLASALSRPRLPRESGSTDFRESHALGIPRSATRVLRPRTYNVSRG